MAVDDYTAVSNLRVPGNDDLRFTRHQTEVIVTITITNDDKIEPTETFELVMAPTNNLFAVKPVGVITIFDDDTRKLERVGGMEGEYGGRWEGVQSKSCNTPCNVMRVTRENTLSNIKYSTHPPSL